MGKYYVYLHRRLSDNLPFYVGKGSGKRAWQVTGAHRNRHWHNVANKHGHKVEIIFDSLTEEQAFALEKIAIQTFKHMQYPLTNMSEGGEGNSGLQFTDQQRLNIAQGLKAKRFNSTENVKLIEVKRPTAYGNNNHWADTTVYSFIRLSDGLEVQCTRHELSEYYGADKTLIKKLFYKLPRKSDDGWRLKEKS